MNYHQITVHTVTEAVEAISYAFMELGAGGVEIFDPKDILEQEKTPESWDYIDEDLLKDLQAHKLTARISLGRLVVHERNAQSRVGSILKDDDEGNGHQQHHIHLPVRFQVRLPRYFVFLFSIRSPLHL